MQSFFQSKGLNFLVRGVLFGMGCCFNYWPKYRKWLQADQRYVNFSLGLSTRDGQVAQSMVFQDGRVRVYPGLRPGLDVYLQAKDAQMIKQLAMLPPNEILILMLKNRLQTRGNLAYLQLFNFYLSLLFLPWQKRALDRDRMQEEEAKHRILQSSIQRGKKLGKVKGQERAERLSGGRPQRGEGLRSKPLRAIADQDQGVLFLQDPYLVNYGLKDFPEIKAMLDAHFTVLPEVCPERPLLLTKWYKENGFENDPQGRPWNPVLRQGHAFHYLMANKRPLIASGSLLPGSTTSKLPTGVVIYPDAQGTLFWGELLTAEKRRLNPYLVSSETRQILHKIFPFWTERNFREWVRKRFAEPGCLTLEERWGAYFCWKSVGLSHTIPDFERVLRLGLDGLLSQIQDQQVKAQDKGQQAVLLGMEFCVRGMQAYVSHLAAEAKRQARKEPESVRQAELQGLAELCEYIAHQPPKTLHQALVLVWIVWIGQHMENTNTGHSLGRMDQWLQRYFVADMQRLSNEQEREHYLRFVLRLVADFYLRCTDHLPLVPDIGNYLFGGSSSDQAITLGGVRPDGQDGVNDLTYIFLKVTEMLSIRDPNVNARIHLEKNSDVYIRRLCAVNLSTCATPSMHNDQSVFKSLARHGYPLEDIRDWSATGCVEPTISGQHIGHTGSILMNLVAGLEMALNNGYHPLFEEQVGPKTGSVEQEDFKSFDEFFQACVNQQAFLIDQAVTLNNMLAQAHVQLRPTPFLSLLIQGCLEKGQDVTVGGAKYNSSGTSNIGLVDVTDSLLVIKKLVFEEKRVSFLRLKKALEDNFKQDKALLALIESKVPLFGSGNPEALDMCQELVMSIHGLWAKHRNFRGGPYTTGFWSMSQHVAYGNLSGALPSGRRAGKAFTPGLTPEPRASDNYLDFISDVAQLNSCYLDNNMAFNVKLVPGSTDSREKSVQTMASYVKTYCQLGGMQMQFNVVSSAVLKDAMLHPENYRNLLVRISGYNAYFVTLNKEQQLELIERAEYGL